MSKNFKYSGFEWIGEIPVNWEVGKVKMAFERKNSKAHEENPVILSLTRKGVKIRDISTGEGQIASSYYDYNPVSKNDLLLNPMDLYSGANCTIANIEGVISPAYVNLKSKKGFNPLFYDYYFKVQYWTMAFFAHGKGVSFENRWTLNTETLMNFPILIPPEKEQNKIANYLSNKIHYVEKIILENENIVKKYNEYKQSLISEVITTGLNNKIQMKDSNVDWIGKIPNDWDIIKAKFLFNQRNQKGNTIELQLLSSTQKFGVIPQELYEELTDMVAVKVKEDADLSSFKCIHQNDYCISLRSFEGGFEFCKYEGVVSPAYSVFFPKVNIDYTYYKYLFKEYGFIENMKSYCMSLRDGKNIAFEDFGNTYIPYPPLHIQHEISEYLDEKCSLIDSLILEKENLINNLEEYKKSIIFEYVTGKKEVPNEI